MFLNTNFLYDDEIRLQLEKTVEADPAKAHRRSAVAHGNIQAHALAAGADAEHRQGSESQRSDPAHRFTVRINDPDALAGGVPFAGHAVAQSSLFVSDLIPRVQIGGIAL